MYTVLYIFRILRTDSFSSAEYQFQCCVLFRAFHQFHDCKIWNNNNNEINHTYSFISWKSSRHIGWKWIVHFLCKERQCKKINKVNAGLNYSYNTQRLHVTWCGKDTNVTHCPNIRLKIKQKVVFLEIPLVTKRSPFQFSELSSLEQDIRAIYTSVFFSPWAVSMSDEYYYRLIFSCLYGFPLTTASRVDKLPRLYRMFFSRQGKDRTRCTHQIKKIAYPPKSKYVSERWIWSALPSNMHQHSETPEHVQVLWVSSSVSD